MKTLFSLFTILWVFGSAQASDVSCQVDVLKPKMNATVIQEESEMPAQMTIAEARIRLKKQTEESKQETVQVEEEEVASKPTKKESGLGSMFDILLPSKLRNPAQ